jgi:hypothetical protein
MNRRTFAAVAMATPLLSACSYDQFFDIEWDEEVLLHDGRIIVMHVKRTYERRDRSAQYEHTTFRRNEFTFDTGESAGRITFGSRLGIGFIDHINGVWYVVFYGQGPYGNHPDELPDRWGKDFTMKEERLAKLEKNEFVPINWEAAPQGSVLFNNLVVGSMSVQVLAAFNGKKMTLEDKKKLLTTYPPGPGGGQISRPIRMQQTLGEKK